LIARGEKSAAEKKNEERRNPCVTNERRAQSAEKERIELGDTFPGEREKTMSIRPPYEELA